MTDDGPFPLQFDCVTIVGVGLIGGSLGMALKQHGLARRIVGLGRNPVRLEQAAALGAIDFGTGDLRNAVRDSDLVVLCTTVGNILESVNSVLSATTRDAVVTDVGSTKSAIVNAARSPRFVGGHPMAGSERTGVEAASAELFQNATWALTPTEDTDQKALYLVRAMAQKIGANTLLISPEAHDAMVAITSHLPHVLASALMRQAHETRSRRPEVTSLSAGSFADLTRIAASSPELWRDVCLSNREAVLNALNAFRGQLDMLQSAIADANGTDIESFFSSGADAKRDWMSAREK